MHQRDLFQLEETRRGTEYFYKRIARAFLFDGNAEEWLKRPVTVQSYVQKDVQKVNLLENNSVGDFDTNRTEPEMSKLVPLPHFVISLVFSSFMSTR